MKSSVQWGLSVGAIALILVGGPSLYLYRQVTQIPSTLTKTPHLSNSNQRRQVLYQGALATVLKMAAQPHQPDGSVVVRLTAEDLNAFFANSMTIALEQSSGRIILLETQVEIDSGTLKTTALLDLSKVSKDALETGDRLSLLHRLFKVPGIRNRSIAIAVEGKPIVRDRILVMDNPIISIGDMHLTTAEAVQWLGISEEIMQERLDQEWAGFPMEVEQVDIIANNSEELLQLQGPLTAW